jgi:acyl-CoA dehydrogenase
MIGFDLTPEQQLLQRTARDFAANEIRPLVGAVRSGRIRPHDWTATRPMFERGAGLGFTRLLVPEAQGGLGGSCIDAVLLLEELGAGDVGVASDLFSLTMVMPLMMLRSGSPTQAEPFLKRVATEALVLAGAQSEPDVAGSELMMGGLDPASGPRLAARRTGERWVLSGAKSAFVTNAGIADSYMIIARTDPAAPPLSGLSIFHVPADTPGLSVGKPTELIGWPLSHHAELRFDDVALAPDALVGTEGGAAMAFGSVPEMGVCLAACFIGLARAAFETALAYARERKSCGQPLAKHQAVALKLANMAVELEAARLLVWRAAAACATDPMRAAMLLAPAAKAKAVDTAIHCAERCVELLGGYGVAREYEAGRFLNDAWVGYSCDFTRDVLHLGIARAL